MPRFSDQWLIDRTVFDYVQGGSCACCSFSFLPNGTQGLIEDLSELETDAAKAEVSALDRLPWPNDMKDQVWMERVRLRQYCKRSLQSKVALFWKTHGDVYTDWLQNQVSPTDLKRWFQLPRSEIVEGLKLEGYHMSAAFGTVLCSVTEQVAHFHVTGYPTDGRGEAEVGFEENLIYDRRGGFTLKHIDSVETKEKWLQRHRTLGGPKLLERNAKVPVNDNEDSDDEGGEDDAEDTPEASSNTVPSFRSDRRILRWLIARHFADVLQRAFFKSHPDAVE